MLLYTAIIIYILSLILGLFLMAAVKRVSKRNFFIGLSIHLLCVVLFFLSRSFSGTDKATENNLFFLFFICSGVILAGVSWRSPVNISFRIYFSLFALTIAMFIFSPSRLMVFLLTAKYTETLGKTFLVKDNYFLEQQGTSTDQQQYKLISKQGMFHKTIQRDLVFKGTLDSIRLLEFIPNEKIVLRGYSGKQTYVSSEIDSTDVSILLDIKKENAVERRL